MQEECDNLDDHRVEMARSHRFRFWLGERVILYAQDVKIIRMPGLFNKGLFVLNLYGAFTEDLTYVLNGNHRGKDARIVLTDAAGNNKIALKLFNVKIVDKGYTTIRFDYTNTDMIRVPVTFSFKKVELEDASL